MEVLGGVIAIVTIGMLAMVVAAIADWRSKRRADAALLAPPPPIGDEPATEPLRYTGLDELERTQQLALLDADQQQALAAELAAPDALVLDIGLVDPGLATHDAPRRAVLRGAKVLVADRIGALREVLASLERAVKEDVPVVLAATAIAPDVVASLAANQMKGVLTGAALILDDEQLASLASATGATGVAQTDLQAGYIPHSVYGHAELVVVDTDTTTVVVGAGTPDLGRR